MDPIYLIKEFIEIILHLDQHLAVITSQYGQWTYLILFLIVFCETGLVVTPFLPGDSLLFAAGAISATSNGNILPQYIAAILVIAALLGDNLNYWVGRFIGPKVFHREKSIFLNKKHLDRTRLFYERHGGKTIIIARFMPIIRTFAPFVAGIGKMNYMRFLSFSIFGALFWVISLVGAGYYFGNIPIVKKNFTVVIFAIIFISILPMIIGFINGKLKKNSDSSSSPNSSSESSTVAL
ncbi:MAG: DedA family protein [Oligoflexia bacterium]|nr:DedA family protein [Oligoflexia bacterium]